MVSVAVQSLPRAETVSCAVCGGGRFETLDTQSLELVSLGRCEIAFGLCAACGHIQQTPPVPPDLMARHYEGFSNYTIFAAPEAARAEPPSWCTRRLLSMVRDLGLTPGRAYEVGAAHGKHLHHFAKAGWQVSGCDLSPKAAEQALALYGIAIDAGPEADRLPRTRDLDLVLVVHVLEHLYEPAATLKRIHGALGPEGHLVLELPCAVEPERLPPGWFAFEHLHYFTPDSLALLLSRAGFETLETRISFTEVLGPVILAAARKCKGPVHARASGAGQRAAKAFARDYVARDAAIWAATAARLARIRGEAFIWGAGVHTAQLLDRTRLADRLTILAVADRDPQKWGQALGGIPVISPETLRARPSDAPIIVSSYFAEAEIVRALRAAGIAEARIVALYGH